ncbi:hypothetical protein IPM19_03120 [bacterium]|nr:MAG: hypothetical protein IPM19_03120 [bacterium]
MFEEIDPDISSMPIYKLQQLVQKQRNEARKALKTLAANGNDNCWDDLLKALESILPPEERKLFKLGKFNMCPTDILKHCEAWIRYQASQGNILIKPSDDDSKFARLNKFILIV